MKVPLKQLAHARSGDKGASANVGVIALKPESYALLEKYLTPTIVQEYFQALGLTGVTRHELPNLGALNFILHNILDGGGSLSLRSDAQGKALGQMLLDITLDIPDHEGKKVLHE